jgi:hypothetical protein
MNLNDGVANTHIMIIDSLIAARLLIEQHQMKSINNLTLIPFSLNNFKWNEC